MNISFDGTPARLQLTADHVILIDPLALDGLAAQLAAAARLSGQERLSAIGALGKHGLRIGVQRLDYPPCMYTIGLDSFEKADADDSDPGVFDIDTGTVVLIDGNALGAVAHAFTWDRYNALLQSPPGDDSTLTAMNAEVGGPRFAIISADADSPFDGDGAFRLRTNGLTRET